MSDASTAAARMKAAEAALTVIYLGGVVWFLMIPPHSRRLLRMRLWAAGQRAAGRLARRAGRAAMKAELATGQAGYDLPYALSLAREASGRAYERLRDVSL